MERIHTPDHDTLRLTEPAEIDAAAHALVAFEAAGTTHITDEDKAQARQLRIELPEQAPTPALSPEAITVLARAAKYLLGTAHHVAEEQRRIATQEALAAAQTIADINKPLTAK